MRTRYKSYQDYGFTDGEEQALESYISGENFGEDDLLRQCCEEAHAGISGFLFQSLRYGSSYDRMSSVEYVPIGRSDFYGWRRKALALFRGRKLPRNCPEEV